MDEGGEKRREGGRGKERERKREGGREGENKDLISHLHYAILLPSA